MIPIYLQDYIHDADNKFKHMDKKLFVLPIYNPGTHYLELTKSAYFRALIIMRNYIKVTSDYYFGVECGAQNVDLFMLTPSISSPMGPGSDSEALPIQFGIYGSNLVDSSQFGFEPLLMNGIDKVYCYLPSMRGEDPDKRHINQFFHCEAEIVGKIDELMPVVEGYFKTLCKALSLMPNILEKLSLDPDSTKLSLNLVIKSDKFPEIEFDAAIDSLVESGNESMVYFTEFGRDITSSGEIKLAELYNFNTPFWIRNYDRDRVPFYQKPDPNNTNKVINADLIIPPIISGAFGGEVAGCGQRQDNAEEMIDSLARQNIISEPYEWYINLRRISKYQATSGFGLGIERFITWSLCRDDIKDSIIYPRLKGLKTYP